jgi:hypothetical protein
MTMGHTWSDGLPMAIRSTQVARKPMQCSMFKAKLYKSAGNISNLNTF